MSRINEVTGVLLAKLIEKMDDLVVVFYDMEVLYITSFELYL